MFNHQSSELYVGSGSLILSMGNVIQIDTRQAMYLQPGDACLVRSRNVNGLGDHIIVVKSGHSKTNHGLRPNVDVIKLVGVQSDGYHPLLSNYQPLNGAVILKLDEKARLMLAEILDREIIELEALTK